MDFGDVEGLNPWWAAPSAIGDDPKLAELGSSGLEWASATLGRFDLDADRVYTLRGPRQVGKTTLLKLLVRALQVSGPSYICGRPPSLPRRRFGWPRQVRKSRIS